MKMIRRILMVTTVIAAASQASATGLMDSSLEDPRVALLNEEQRDFCNREEIDAAELYWLRRSPDFDLILNNALENCPERALLLVDPATATTIEGRTGDKEDRNRRPPTPERTGGQDKPKDPPTDKPKDPPTDKPKDPPKDDPKDPPKDDQSGCRTVAGC